MTFFWPQFDAACIAVLRISVKSGLRHHVLDVRRCVADVQGDPVPQILKRPFAWHLGFLSRFDRIDILSSRLATRTAFRRDK